MRPLKNGLKNNPKKWHKNQSKIMGLFGTIFSGISDMANNLIQAKVQRQNVDKTIAANKAMAEYQYSKDVEMWNKGNAYNNPAAQMERLKAANLNPNLVYGTGSVAGNSSGQLPKYNAPNIKYDYTPSVRIPEVISTYQNLKQQQAQTNLINQNIKNAETIAIGKELDNTLKAIQSQYWALNAATQSRKLGFDTDLSQWRGKEAEANIAQKRASTAYTEENTKYNKLLQSGVISKNVLLSEQARQASRLVNLQLDNMESALRLKNAEYPLKMEDLNLKLQQQRYNEKKIQLADKELFYYPYRNPWSLIGGAAEGIDLLTTKFKKLFGK